MALKLPDFMSRTDAKSRLLLMILTLAGVAGLVFLGMHFFGSKKGISAAHVAAAPSGLQSVPGSQVSQEYYKALMLANKQAAQKAQMTGGSAVPTMVNVPTSQSGFVQSSTNCGSVCPGEDSDNIIDDINNLMKLNKLGQDDGNMLLDLVKNNVAVLEFSPALDKLVFNSKLAPEDGRRLLEEYKKHYTLSISADSAKAVDALIKSGQISVAVGNDLIDLQKRNLTPAEYAAELQRLVREGKITPEMAAMLLAQYTKQKAQEALKNSAVVLKQMAASGRINTDVAATLTKLQERNPSVSQYDAELQKLVNAGKMTPATAAQLLAQYKKQRIGLGPASDLKDMISAAESANNDDINALVAGGKLSQEAANKLLDMQKSNQTPEDYQKELDELVREGKISPEEAKRLMAAYNKLHGLRSEAQKLTTMQGNNASIADYSNELKNAVLSGQLSPEQAAQLLQSYQTMSSPVTPSGGIILGADKNVPGAEDFAKLQQRLAAQERPGSVPVASNNTQQFTAAQAQAASQAEQAQQQRIQDLMGAMKGQADKLMIAWQPPTMRSAGSWSGETKASSSSSSTTTEKTRGVSSAGDTSDASLLGGGPPLIKSGTILFAILDTGVDSDYPDTPVMATVVQGKYKGAKLMGKVTLGQGQGQDRVSLNFTMMDMDDWDRTKPVTAFAIDPETARTVLASNVDYHYFKKYGSIMATSFLTGYASAITGAGTSATTLTGMASTHPELDPANKLAVGLGQVGTTLGTAIQSNISTLPTVKVNAGVGLGILFMSDVTDGPAPKGAATTTASK